MEDRKETIMKRLDNDYALLESKGYEVLGVFLYGSDNYHLSDEKSDIDTKAIIIPTFDDLIFKNEYESKTFEEEDGSLMDVKDIRHMFNIFLKPNINFLEVLFTPYFKLNPNYFAYFSGKIFKNAEKIAHYNKSRFLFTIYGEQKSRFTRLLRDTPSSHEEVEKYGYSLKNFHHIIRMGEFASRFVDGESFASCMVSRMPEELIKYKRVPLPLNEMMQIAEDSMNRTNMLCQRSLDDPEFEKIDTEVEEILKDAQRYLIQQFLMEQICDCERERIINGQRN